MILLESANTRFDHPGVLCSTTPDSVVVADMVAHPCVKVLYDLYHSVVEGEDPESALKSAMHQVVHVQVADAPGRGEPGSGLIDWSETLQMFERVGYNGTLGLELQPTKASTEAFAYIQGLCA